MRGFKIICGIGVLFISLHMVHAIHHFHHMRPEMSGSMFWGMMSLAVMMDLLSITGGLLLLIGK